MGQRLRVAFGAHTHDQPVLVHAAGHVAAQQEPDAAEHLLLDEVGRAGQKLSNSSCQGLVIGHWWVS
ncbi:MAG: hypothetical protein AMJ93_08160 [Anaerolineae bacterium SM23_84]|nr:MAG: hypothetical protein AMJ93_08160 [Anaerolineae bacterium SM23_84]